MKRAVSRITQSPMNNKRWCIELECGHEVWETVSRKPKRSELECSACPAPVLSPPRVKFMDADFRREPKTGSWCCCCQRDMSTGRPFRWVHLVHGGMFVLHPDDEARFSPGCELLFEDGSVAPDQGDMGLFKIGPECVRRMGLEWSRPDGEAT